MRRIVFSVDAPIEGERLDRAIAERGGLSRNFARRVITAGGVMVDGKRVQVTGRRLSARQEVRVHIASELESPPAASTPARSPGEGEAGVDESRILYRDRDVVAVDKPAGVAAQATLTNSRALPELVSDAIGGPASLVHRLDRDTSGVTVLGRHKGAVTAMAESFREGRVAKVYLALVADGDPGAAAVSGSRDSGRWDGPLGKDPASTGRWRVVEGGVPAATRWSRVERFGQEEGATGFSLMRLEPLTGRTHQLRAHLSDAGSPILGDRKYGGPTFVTFPDGRRVEIPRMLLHAHRLALPHPRTGETLELEAPIPADMIEMARALGLRAGVLTGLAGDAS